MSKEEIKDTIKRLLLVLVAREAGLLDGGTAQRQWLSIYTQFLSSGINDRQDEYGGLLENRARFLLGNSIRKEVGNDFHLQTKISAVEYNNAVILGKPGNTLEDSSKSVKWVEEAGADAIHVSTGTYSPSVESGW